MGAVPCLIDRVRTAGAVVLAVGLLSAVAAPRGFAAPENAPRQAGLRVGEMPPELNATRLAGDDPVSVELLRGRVVVLDFWATWCGPCLQIMPSLDRLHREHHDAGLTVLGISDERSDLIARHLGRRPVGYTVARDLGGTGRRYGVRSFPKLVVIDRSGKVQGVFDGINAPRMRELQRLIERLLAEEA